MGRWIFTALLYTAAIYVLTVYVDWGVLAQHDWGREFVQGMIAFAIATILTGGMAIPLLACAVLLVLVALVYPLAWAARITSPNEPMSDDDARMGFYYSQMR